MSLTNTDELCYRLRWTGNHSAADWTDRRQAADVIERLHTALGDICQADGVDDVLYRIASQALCAMPKQGDDD